MERTALVVSMPLMLGGCNSTINPSDFSNTLSPSQTTTIRLVLQHRGSEFGNNVTIHELQGTSADALLQRSKRLCRFFAKKQFSDWPARALRDRIISGAIKGLIHTPGTGAAWLIGLPCIDMRCGTSLAIDHR